MNIKIIIENSAFSRGVKYEINEQDGLLYVDRIMDTQLVFPANYGFIPNTKGKDGDCQDVLLISEHALEVQSVIKGRIIGALAMADEKGIDDKIIAVPASEVSPGQDHIQEIEHLPSHLLASIKHFFEHYKDLEEGKFTDVGKFISRRVAEGIVNDSMSN